ncbi:MAG: hypothetical protein KC561_11405 [Myxococcales bacterium]|nr:hypothetical protein [Myxococcales bacterium]
MRIWSISSSVIALLLFGGCWADLEQDPVTQPGQEQDDRLPSDAVTYQEHVRPLIETHCQSCHVPGGIGPIPLTNYAEVREAGPELVFAVESGTMPPWKPADTCHPLQGSRRLTSAEIDTFSAWQSFGRPEGDEADYVAPDEVEDEMALGEPDIITAAASGYAPNRLLPDDYRCMLLTQEFENDTFLRATDLDPDVREMVHHVIFYLIAEEDVPEVMALDDDEEGEGYTCFGGAGVQAQTIGGWVPGSVAMVWPTGSAIRVPAGSRIVAQFHYNVANMDRDEPLPEDASEALLWLTDEADVRATVTFLGMANSSIVIEPGDPESAHTMELTSPIYGYLVGLLPHMHTLGSEISVDLERLDGTEDCMVDIPEWDFNWQQLYTFPEDDPVWVNAGETFTLRCEYDNSAANQPVVNGEQLAPRRVTWGEGTADEMCLSYLTVAIPYDGDPEYQCETLPDCWESCDDEPHRCALACSSIRGGECSNCVFDGLNACAQDVCLLDLAVLGQCLEDCDDVGECLAYECVDEFDDVLNCLEPHLEDGSCDDDFSACGIRFGD